MAGDMKLGGGGRFAKLKGELASKGIKNPGGLAATIGRKKYGSKKFNKLAQGGRAQARKQAANEIGKEMSHG